MINLRSLSVSPSGRQRSDIMSFQASIISLSCSRADNYHSVCLQACRRVRHASGTNLAQQARDQNADQSNPYALASPKETDLPAVFKIFQIWK
jgi:hypothetical protein